MQAARRLPSRSVQYRICTFSNQLAWYSARQLVLKLEAISNIQISKTFWPMGLGTPCDHPSRWSIEAYCVPGHTCSHTRADPQQYLPLPCHVCPPHLSTSPLWCCPSGIGSRPLAFDSLVPDHLHCLHLNGAGERGAVRACMGACTFTFAVVLGGSIACSRLGSSMAL